ncbi:MAG: TolC family protein [Planctomycetes bacterium]|nr:TolC family protein [Planctomycetota bacterium]
MGWILSGCVLLGGCVGSRLTPEDHALIDRVAGEGAALRSAQDASAPSAPIAAAAGAPDEGRVADAGAPLALADLVAIALRRNPEVRVAEAKLAAAKARIGMAGALDDPKVGVEFDEVPISISDPTEGDRKGSVMQDVPFPGKLGLRADVAESAARVAEQELGAKRRDVVAMTKRAFFELYGVERSLAIQKEQIALLEQFVAIAQSKYQNGRVTQQDVLKAQVELAQLQNEVLMLEQERSTTRVELNRALSRPERATLGSAPEKLDPDPAQPLEELRRRALAERPELRGALAEVERSLRARELAEKDRLLPDFTLEARYMSRRMEEDRWMGALSLNVPWFNSKHGYEVKEANAMAAAARSEFLAARNLTLADVESAFVRVETSRRLAELFRSSILPQAEQALAAAQKGYETDRVDFLSLIDSQRALRGIKLAYQRTLADFGRQTADLERAVGGDLAK